MTERFEIVESVIISMLEEKKYLALRDILATMNPVDVAAIFADLKERQIPLLFRLLPKELAAETFAEMDPEDQELLISRFSDNELAELMEELYADDAADMVEELPANVVKRVLRQAPPEMRRAINQLLRYPENSAGSIMTTEYVSLRPDMTVEDAILRIRRQGFDKETIYTCYVTKDRKLLGIVTFDDAMDVIEEETTEDMELMGGMLPSEKTYLRSSVWQLFKSRIPWLLLLMVSSTFTGMIITSFEGALAAQAALTAFIPMLMGTGGNSGSQSSVTVIRALSLDELRFSDLPRVIWKEIRTAVLCGIALAAVCFLKIWFVDRLLLGNFHITLGVNAVVCISMALTVLLAKLTGAVLPIAAKALKLDPAVMASPFITTVVDAVSLLVYFLFARLLLGV